MLIFQSVRLCKNNKSELNNLKNKHYLIKILKLWLNVTHINYSYFQKCIIIINLETFKRTIDNSNKLFILGYFCSWACVFYLKLCIDLNLTVFSKGISRFYSTIGYKMDIRLSRYKVALSQKETIIFRLLFIPYIFLHAINII